MKHFGAALFLALLLIGSAFAAINFPALTGPVVDEAGVLPASLRTQLAQELETHRQRTGQQVVVATVKSLQGVEIEDYGVDLGRTWKIGQKGTNTGAILLVAPNEKRVRIEVGYGLEGVLTDAASRVIIERTILPQIRRGDLPAGVAAGTHEMLRVLSGDIAAEDLAPVRGPRAAKDPGGTVSGLISTALFFFVIWLVWRRRSSGIGSVIWPILLSSSWGRGGGGGSWGGGSGGGGGGYSGGGGSFGGGGASGSW